MKGEDQHGVKLVLIQGDIKFFEDQKIQFIMFNEEESPYENMLFIQFEKTCQLIKKLTSSAVEKKLFYHLPYYDYMLFGIELYMKGRITQDALSDFFKIIDQKRVEHTEKINGICKKYDISCRIFSPFDNIFGDESTPSKIFDLFIRDEVDPEKIKREEVANREKDFIVFCIEKLTKNAFNVQHQKIWNDFVNSVENKIENLEDLFKIANAISVAVASKGKEGYKTCSILPLSEKQIQVGYSKNVKSMKNEAYPPVFNLALLDPLLSYTTSANNGLLFYFDHECSANLTKFMKKKNLVDKAYQNIGLFSSNKPSLLLKSIMDDDKSVKQCVYI